MTTRKRKRLALDSALEAAIAAAGNSSKLARSLGVSKAAVSQWRAVPIRHVERVAGLYRISKRRLLEPHLLRP